MTEEEEDEDVTTQADDCIRDRWYDAWRPTQPPTTAPPLDVKHVTRVLSAAAAAADDEMVPLRDSFSLYDPSGGPCCETQQTLHVPVLRLVYAAMHPKSYDPCMNEESEHDDTPLVSTTLKRDQLPSSVVHASASFAQWADGYQITALDVLLNYAAHFTLPAANVPLRTIANEPRWDTAWRHALHRCAQHQSLQRKSNTSLWVLFRLDLVARDDDVSSVVRRALQACEPGATLVLLLPRVQLQASWIPCLASCFESYLFRPAGFLAAPLVVFVGLQRRAHLVVEAWVRHGWLAATVSAAATETAVTAAASTPLPTWHPSKTLPHYDLVTGSSLRIHQVASRIGWMHPINDGASASLLISHISLCPSFSSSSPSCCR